MLSKSIKRVGIKKFEAEIKIESCTCEANHQRSKLIVITGGPGAGKTALLEIARKKFCEHTAILPEAASILFKGGLERHDTVIGRKATQRAIYHVQKELEIIARELNNMAIALCDRGSLDGLAYWPGTEADFFEDLVTDCNFELSRYAAVIHLKTPGLDQGYNHINPFRIENAQMAAEIDLKIAHAWRDHPRRYIVESENDFLTKVTLALDYIRLEFPECCRQGAMKT
jgi:predicted ATPase